MVKAKSFISGILTLLLIFLNASDINSSHRSIDHGMSLLVSDAPEVHIKRDDHVATIEMDFDANDDRQLWNVDDSGLVPIGYRVQWWLDDSEVDNVISECGCANDQITGDTVLRTSTNPYQTVTSNTTVQIQPIANNVMYHLRVEKLNSFGQVCSPAATMTFMGGDPTRVNDLRNTMTFFDDFNLPMGPADERNWNNATTPQTDPRFNLFFINPQCHTHTLTGTLNGASGDRAQVAQRPRKPIVIDSVEERRIVFDMDGIFSPRSVWYLDLNPLKTDLTGHMSFFDSDGDEGLPADIFRLRAQHNELGVHLINSQGASYKVAGVNLSDFGKRLSTNVRRSFDIRLNTAGVKIYVDSTLVMDESFDPGDFKPGVYNLLWSTIGYNTSKSDNPYFLSHWDNFGFDGPDVEPYVIHNYVTRIDSTDYQRSHSNSNSHPIFNIQIPDDIRPIQAVDTNEIWLVFTYKIGDWSTHIIQPGDHVLFNGASFPLPEGINNSSPVNPDLIGYAGSILTNRIKVGTAYYNSPSPLLEGMNTAQFFATNAGIMNVHIEVICSENATPPQYTQPAQIHYFPLHGHLPKLGIPARMIDIDNISINSNEMIGPQVSGVVPIEVLVGNDRWAGWAPHLLRMPAESAELWSSGGTKGVEELNFFIRPVGDTTAPGILFESINCAVDAPAPQIRYAYQFDAQNWANGTYEIFVQAKNPNGIKSHPAYSGFGFKWNASELSGAYDPVEITIENPAHAEYTFLGTSDSLWSTDANWDTGRRPPQYYNGVIKINANCEVPPGGVGILLGADAELIVQPNIMLNVKGLE